MNNIDISWIGLIIGLLTLILPIFILNKYKTGLVKDTIISFGRMAIQLIFVGFYLKYIFEFDSWMINIAWVILMIVIASASVTKRSNLKLTSMMLPVIISVLCNVVFNGIVFAFLLDGFENLLNARYLIPIMGMVIGNTLSSSIIGIRSFFQKLIQNENTYLYMLSCGANKEEAILSFISNAFRDAFNPVIASTAAIGLIWLPGMMTGQILGGSDPFTAIKYQIVIVSAIFAGSVLTVYLTINLAKSIAFDDWGIIRKNIYKKV